MLKYLKDKIEYWLFFIGLIIYLSAPFIANALYKLKSSENEQYQKQLIRPVPKMVETLIGFLAVIAFMMIVSSALVTIIKIFKSRRSKRIK